MKTPIIGDRNKSMSLRVALISNKPRALNGVAEYYRNVLPHLRRNIDIVVASPDQYLGASDIAIQTLGIRGPWWTPEVDWLVPVPGEMESVLTRVRPNLIHIMDTNVLSVLALRAGRRLGIPVVATSHTNLVGFVDTAYHCDGITRAARTLMRNVFGRASAVATLNGVTAHALADVIGISSSRVRILRSGVDSKRFHPPNGLESRSRKECRLLTVSRLSPEKRVSVVLQAHNKLVHDIWAELTVVGRGPSARKLIRQAGERVFFAGALVGKHLARAYREADLFVLASPFEVCPQVLLEAQASGLPCVVSPSGAAWQTIVPGVSGIVAEADDADAFHAAIRTILKDDDLRLAMSGSARDVAVRASWVCAANDLSNWYQDVHAQFGGRPLAS